MILAMNRHEDTGQPSEWQELYLRQDDAPQTVWSVEVLSGDEALCALGEDERTQPGLNVAVRPGALLSGSGEPSAHGEALLVLPGEALTQAQAQDAAIKHLVAAGHLKEGACREGEWEDFSAHHEARTILELSALVQAAMNDDGSLDDAALNIEEGGFEELLQGAGLGELIPRAGDDARQARERAELIARGRARLSPLTLN